ncbi:MAG: sugar phosphate isomerase/epimerase [Cytophagaceae bacterium]|nr:sugar phosphate isomerase/epimerase [Cytophagaceae bacterium]
MTTNRRTFLKTGTLALAGVPILSLKLRANKPLSHIGLQLYSLRDDMSKDPRGTIKAVAKAGYKEVEHAGYGAGKFYGLTPTDFKQLLADNGLTMPSGHTALLPKHVDSQGNFTDEWKKTVDDAAILGQKYVISPWIDISLRKSADSLKRVTDLFNRAGELCQRSGMKFGYHNHDFEMDQVDGQVIYDILLSNTDPKLVTMEMDVGWVTAPGGDPVYWFKKYPGRFGLLHMRDIVRTTGAHKFTSVVLGDGVVKFDEILKNHKLAGTKYFIVEQEEYGKNTALEAVTLNYGRISRMKG